MQTVVYVDNLNGSDSNEGDILNPVSSLSVAYALVRTGGTIVLQEGNGASYGDLSVNRNVNLQAAYGSSPGVGLITIAEAQGSFQNLSFSAGLSVVGTKGAIKVTECAFNNVDTGINLDGVKYVTITKSTFSSYKVGILIQNAEEVIISSNVFYNNGFKAIEVITVDRIDLWRNTIHGAVDTGSSNVISDENLRIIYRTLTASNINNKNVPLTGFAVKNTDLDGTGYLGYDIAVNVVDGPSFQYGVDYVGTAGGYLVSWDGRELDSVLQVGDILRIMYSEDIDPGGGEAIRVLNVSDPNSTIDSNNIGNTTSDIALGVFFNTALKIRYNNFYRATLDYNNIATPTSALGNFSDDPLYTNAGMGDFSLQVGSPNIDAGDPTRWDSIMEEIGVGVVGGGYTGIGGATRVNTAPFDRDLDISLVDRKAADELRLGPGMFTGDIGAHEYTDGTHTGEYYVDESGYDRAYFGGSSDPFSTIDRAFDPSLADDSINIVTNPVVPGGSSYGRYSSKNMALSDRDLKPGNETKKDIVYVTPTFPSYDTGAVYVGPDGADDTGDGSYSNPYRTITRALQDPGQSIIVFPGIYPQFTGEINKKLIGVPLTKEIALPWSSYCNTRKVDWNLTDDVSFEGRGIVFTDVASIDSWSPTNKFEFSGGIEASASVLVGDILTVSLESTTVIPEQDSDRGAVELKKVGADLSVLFKFTINGSSFTYLNIIPSFTFTNRVRVSVCLRDGKISTSASAIGFSKTKSLLLFSTDSWSMKIASAGIGSSEIKNLVINADSFSSTYIEVSTSAHTRRKIFAIQGNG
jgi:parallel beta-helix repeat protein